MKEELKYSFTSYWQYLALKTACKKNIFDLISSGANTIKKISVLGKFNEVVLTDLINALEQANTVKIVEQMISLTAKGELLTESNPDTLKYACIHWGEEHLTAWQNLEYTLLTGKQSFIHIFGKPLFDYLSDDKLKLENYHKAMSEYARDDYHNICKVHDFSIHKSLTDVGGGLGALINIISKCNPYTKCYLFDKEEVLNLTNKSEVEQISGNFFKSIPNISDAIIMSRVIHDWNDEKALLILENVYKALPNNGTLYLLENLTDKINDKAALLSLNMHLITESFERSLFEYKSLLEEGNFKYSNFKKVNNIQYLIIAHKK